MSDFPPIACKVNGIVFPWQPWVLWVASPPIHYIIHEHEGDCCSIQCLDMWCPVYGDVGSKYIAFSSPFLCFHCVVGKVFVSILLECWCSTQHFLHVHYRHTPSLLPSLYSYLCSSSSLFLSHFFRPPLSDSPLLPLPLSSPLHLTSL